VKQSAANTNTSTLRASSDNTSGYRLSLRPTQKKTDTSPKTKSKKSHSPSPKTKSKQSHSPNNENRRPSGKSVLGRISFRGVRKALTNYTRRGSQSSEASRSSRGSGISDDSASTSASTIGSAIMRSHSGNSHTPNAYLGYSLQSESSSQSRLQVANDQKQLIVRDFGENLLLEAKREEETLTLSLWDFGGQAVFYSMHHIFLTKSGVYILVFDMRVILDSDVEAITYIKFWLRSIKLHAPEAPIIMVGTYNDDVSERVAVRSVNDTIRDLTKTNSSASQLTHNTSENLEYFPVDNKSKMGIPKLRSTVEAVIRKDKNVALEVSIKWILLLDEILSNRRHETYVTLSDVKQMAEGVGIHSASELEEALNLFHERGMLFHLTSTEMLKNIIIIKPQWLVDALSKVIRDDNLHMFNRNEFEQAGLGADLRRAFEKALASRRFLDYVWKNDQVEFLIDLMKHVMLLCEWNFNGYSNFLVPSLIQQNFVGDVEDWLFVQSGVQCMFDFSTSFLPNGIFQRIICLCVQHSVDTYNNSNNDRPLTMTAPKLYRDYAMLQLEPGKTIHVQVDTENNYLVVSFEDNSHVAAFFNIINNFLVKMNEEVMSSGLRWVTHVQDEATGEFVKYEQAEKHKIYPWFETQT